MSDSLLVKKDKIQFYGFSKFELTYDSIEELHELLHNFLNPTQYEKIYLKKGLQKESREKMISIYQDGVYYSPYGMYQLKLVVDRSVFVIVRDYLSEFQFKKLTPQKTLKLDKKN